jgi:hypothetical protein
MSFFVRIHHSQRDPRAIDVSHEVNAYNDGGRPALKNLGSTGERLRYEADFGTATIRVTGPVSGGFIVGRVDRSGAIYTQGPFVEAWHNGAGISVLLGETITVSRCFIGALEYGNLTVTEV